MTQNNHLITILSLFLSVFLFSCASHISGLIIPRFLLNNGLSTQELYQIESIEMLGYIIAGLFLTQLINKISLNKITIVALVILIIIDIINLLLMKQHINNYLILRINFIIMALAYYSYLIITIIKIVEYANNYKYSALISFAWSWIAGYLAVYSLSKFLESTTNGLIFCILLYALIIITCLYKENIHKETSSRSKFSFLIENIELQILTGFIVSYINFEILWYYEGFALAKKFPISDIDYIMHYVFLNIFFIVPFVIYLLKIINKYLANLILIVILLINFILLPYYGVTFIGNILIFSIIGLCLCSIFICNILILSDKFESHNLKTALVIYFTMCSIGMYSGALSSNMSHGSSDVDLFLFSSFVVVGIFVLYYLWYFIKNKLYR